MAILDKIKTKFVNKRFLKLELLTLGILSIIAYILYVADVPPVMAQDAAAALPDVLMPQRGQRVLVFSPHPDDESIGIGGYITQSIENGANVEIVLVTNGDFHDNEQERYAEFKKATQILGVPESNLVFLGFPDGKLDELDPTVLSLALQSQIEQFNPEYYNLSRCAGCEPRPFNNRESGTENIGSRSPTNNQLRIPGPF